MCQWLGLWYLDVPSEQNNQMNLVFFIYNLTEFPLAVLPFISSALCFTL